MRILRGLLGAAGIALILVGAWHVLEIGRTDVAKLVNLALWLAGGVIAHDAVIGPLVVLVGVVVIPRLPSWSRAPVTAGLIVLLSLTLLGIPVIGRFGLRPDVPSLLNRPYGLLWLGLALLVSVVVAIASLLRRRSDRPGERPVERPVEPAEDA